MSIIIYAIILPILIITITTGFYFYHNNFIIFNTLLIFSWLISVSLSIYQFGFFSFITYILISLFTTISTFIYFYYRPKILWKREELKNKKWGTTIDCRHYSEYEKGHYPSAIHWPISTLNPKNIEARLHSIKFPVLVYDNTGKQSKEWCDTFNALQIEMGFTKLETYYTDAHWTQIPLNNE